MSTIETDAPDLAYSGRESNHDLSFRRWNASSHASYYTSNEIALAIADALLSYVTAPTRGYTINGAKTVTSASELVVFDPTCGSGRLLVPFRKAGCDVLGVELDEDAAAVAKKNLASKNVRVGDILLYRKILKGLDWREGTNVIVTNPPFGLWWDVPTNEGWETVNKHGKVESQAFTIELCAQALKPGGLLVAIIPSSTFENGKDAALRAVLYTEFSLLSRITVEHAFAKEYGIDVSVDIIVAKRVQRSLGAAQKPRCERTDAMHPMFAQTLRTLIGAQLPADGLPTIQALELPQPRLFVSLPISTNVEITAKGVTGDLSARAMLDFLNETRMEYSPVQGTSVGIIDAYLSRPALLKRGWSPALRALRDLGFTVDISKRTSDTLDRQRKRYERLTIPLYRPKSHQLLGYFDDKLYTTKADVETTLCVDAEGAIVRDKGSLLVDPSGKSATLWQKGYAYRVQPTWVRRKEVAAEETVHNASKNRDETVRTEIERGYLQLMVETEAGTLAVPETDEQLVTLFLSAFDLPEVEDVDDLLTVEVERNRALLARQSPHLLDYQLEDTARLLTKARGYLGWEVGGGKTCSSIAWAQARQYRRVLVVCEATLIEKWLDECKKFGAEAHRLTTHRSVAQLRERIRRGEKPTGFYITSYEFLALDGSKTFAPWDCVKYDRDGNERHKVEGITSEACACGATYQNTVKECPACKESETWTGQSCGCGYIAYTYDGARRQRPAYKTVAKLFPCLIADEAQVAKSKLSLRGQALRSIKTKGCLILTATIFKGYVTDLFWLISFVLRWNNPLFPYTYSGGSKRFLDCYGTYKFVTREFEDTLHTGKAQLLPEVSSLNLFARMMAPFMVRRVDGEMAVLPPKHRHVLRADMRRNHADLYADWETWATDRIRVEPRRHEGADVNMGVISQSLWAMRFAASAPTASDHLQYEGGPNPATLPSGSSWSKMDEVIRLVREIAAKGEKVIVTSPLRPLVRELGLRLKKERIAFTPILASTKPADRHGIVRVFNHDTTPVLLAAMGCITRGLDIIGANHIIVCAFEWSPETLIQVCGRIHRPGQTKECHEYLVLSADTIDDDMLALCESKHQALREAIDAEKRYRSVAEILERATNAAQLEVARKVAARPRVHRVIPIETVTAPLDAPDPVEPLTPIAATGITQFSLF